MDSTFFGPLILDGAGEHYSKQALPATNSLALTPGDTLSISLWQRTLILGQLVASFLLP